MDFIGAVDEETDACRFPVYSGRRSPSYIWLLL